MKKPSLLFQNDPKTWHFSPELWFMTTPTPAQQPRNHFRSSKHNECESSAKEISKTGAAEPSGPSIAPSVGGNNGSAPSWINALGARSSQESSGGHKDPQKLTRTHKEYVGRWWALQSWVDTPGTRRPREGVWGSIPHHCTHTLPLLLHPTRGRSWA